MLFLLQLGRRRFLKEVPIILPTVFICFFICFHQCFQPPSRGLNASSGVRLRTPVGVGTAGRTWRTGNGKNGSSPSRGLDLCRESCRGLLRLKFGFGIATFNVIHRFAESCILHGVIFRNQDKTTEKTVADAVE